MAFGFSDIGSMFGKGMAQYGQGLDKMRDLPMADKMMAAGQIAHGGVSPMSMFGAVNRLGAPGAPAGPGAPPMMPGQPPGQDPAPPPPAMPPAASPAQGGQNDPSGLFGALLPMLMKNGGMGALGGLASGGGMGGLLGKFGFGG